MRYLAGVLIAAVLAVLHVSVMQYVDVLGVTPDLVLIFAASWAVVRRKQEAAVIVPLTGFLKDLVTSDPLGTSVLALAPIVLLAAATRLRAVDTEFVPTVLVIVSGSLAYGIISMTVLAITGQTVVWDQAVVRTLLPACLVNALFTPLIYLPLHTFSGQDRSSTIGSRRLISPL